MQYFFPGIVDSIRVEKKTIKKISYSFDSASSALRFVLRYYDLKRGDKIAIPAFVCDSVQQAIVFEGLEVIKLDLKEDDSFWSNYDLQIITSAQVKVVILVHLYGFLHPNTRDVIDFCRKKQIYLIHDLAQCYGVDEDQLGDDAIRIYSFGPGKSSVAALGGFVKGINDELFFNKHTYSLWRFSIATFIFDARAKFFVKSRIYKYQNSAREKLLCRVVDALYFYLYHNRHIYTMTEYQQNLACFVIERISEVRKERMVRYNMIANAVNFSKHINLAYVNENGNYFKAVICCNSERQKFSKYLIENHVPYFRLFEENNVSYLNSIQLPNFKKRACGFFEFSTELSLPLEEIERLASILKNFKA